jgi:hypothetical protein
MGFASALPILQFLPDGQIKKTCPALFAKIFRFRRRANHRYKLAPSRPEKRGVSRSSRTLGAGCGGRGSAGAQRESQGEPSWLVSDHPARRRTALNPPWSRFRWGCTIHRCNWRRRAAYGEVVWSWHPLLMSSWRRRSRPNRVSISLNPLATVTKGIRRRGERAISRKAIAQGRSDCLR